MTLLEDLKPSPPLTPTLKQNILLAQNRAKEKGHYLTSYIENYGHNTFLLRCICGYGVFLSKKILIEESGAYKYACHFSLEALVFYLIHPDECVLNYTLLEKRLKESFQ